MLGKLLVMNMTAQRWRYIQEYSKEVFGQEDAHLSGLMQEAIANGLPSIAITADVGRLLMILASTTRGRLAIEVGTLGGYSGIWLARGLANAGRLITIELEDKHADFAQRQFELASVANRIEIKRGAALDVLPHLAEELEPGSVDVVFLDAVKSEYPQYWTLIRNLIAKGGIILADNALGSDTWHIDDESDPQRIAMDKFNRLVASDPEFEASIIPLRNGVLVGRRM
ncbi:MAG: O-methyltransferase [Planctomycetes bacterium]|nr:O-methyltransferase [Planctomycetota bacterium]